VQEQQKVWPEQLAQQVSQRLVRWARLMAVVVQLVLPRAEQEPAARPAVLQAQASELQEERSPERQQVRTEAQELRAMPQALRAREPEASPLPGPDTLLVAGVRWAQVFAVQPWPRLLWLRDRLRRLPRHRRHPSSDDELFQQLPR
jgi:hypothetical protein